ncbi:uncharacterized protein MELLADRAFT_79698 [Melampsora larici-populina 98AG31]|uniref:Carbohydrate esterase family 16 protein n=1 Tax=Melampsora larici-populina (strain 98AG31 / pathotype 3-4-7) TaxID=747676 RepID=F4SAA2_MELLP|nr:uncharacterized protein MELLADRAFT_79698 [Melampsora larici-populina 98AG31]EGF98415.1 hypothetical protein MELLADRAFT_79698 [Melampsora larici-populina 98AG31]
MCHSFFKNVSARHLLIVYLASSALVLVGARTRVVSRRELSFVSFESRLSVDLESRQSSQTSEKHTSIVVFGASWADNAHPRPDKYKGTFRDPPYYKGRYSNGIIWAEYLAQSLLTGRNIPLLDYAYGGAVASNTLTYTDKPDTNTQSDTYISDVRNGKINRGAGPVLHFWWIGLNQITQIWTDAIKADPTARQPDVVAKAHSQVQDNVAELKRQVVKVMQDPAVQRAPCDFFIVPIPNMAEVLTFQFQAVDLSKNVTQLAKTYVDFIGDLSYAYNQGIARFVSEMQTTYGSPTTHGWVRTMDFESFWKSAIDDPRKYQLEVSDKACLQSVNGTQVVCANPEKYVFWDSLHPTTAMHKLIAANLVPAINVARLLF